MSRERWFATYVQAHEFGDTLGVGYLVVSKPGIDGLFVQWVEGAL